MFEITKTVCISEVAKADVARLRQETTLEGILETCQTVVANPDRYEVELRCYAAALAVVVVDLINQERFEACAPDGGA